MFSRRAAHRSERNQGTEVGARGDPWKAAAGGGPCVCTLDLPTLARAWASCLAFSSLSISRSAALFSCLDASSPLTNLSSSLSLALLALSSRSLSSLAVTVLACANASGARDGRPGEGAKLLTCELLSWKRPISATTRGGVDLGLVSPATLSPPSEYIIDVLCLSSRVLNLSLSRASRASTSALIALFWRSLAAMSSSACLITSPTRRSIACDITCAASL